MTLIARHSPGWLRYVPHGRWALTGYAFLLGLLLFAAVWMRAREHAVAPAPVRQPAAAAQPALEPLPGPAPAGNARPLPDRPAEARLVEEQPPPEPLLPESASAPGLPPNLESAPPPAPSAVRPPRPLPDQAPPRYPPGALRRGESGTVVVRVEVGVDGRPASLRIERRSGSRDLDRAAVEAVARWRFEPARGANGQAVAASLSIPIDFASH